jgi:hypothetical protein
MIELVDTLPDVNVQPAEYKRLLGYPRDRVLTDRARELADMARAWYTKHGRPWVYAREVEHLDVNGGDLFVLDDVPFSSKRLHKTLRDAEAHGAVLVAVSAGPEVEAEAQRLWFEEKPDEYFFTEIYGSAVVEHLVTTIGARLCGWADAREMAVLPHYSPGYPEWDIAEQPRLLHAKHGAGAQADGPDPVRELLTAALPVSSGRVRARAEFLAQRSVARRESQWQAGA